MKQTILKMYIWHFMTDKTIKTKQAPNANPFSLKFQCSFMFGFNLMVNVFLENLKKRIFSSFNFGTVNCSTTQECILFGKSLQVNFVLSKVTLFFLLFKRLRPAPFSHMPSYCFEKNRYLGSGNIRILPKRADKQRIFKIWEKLWSL